MSQRRVATGSGIGGGGSTRQTAGATTAVVTTTTSTKKTSSVGGVGGGGGGSSPSFSTVGGAGGGIGAASSSSVGVGRQQQHQLPPGSLSLEIDDSPSLTSENSNGGGKIKPGNSYDSSGDEMDDNNNNNYEGDDRHAMLASVEERYENERHKLRTKQWRESPFAVGFTEATWSDERHRSLRSTSMKPAYGDDELVPDHSGCLCCSAMVCPMLGAGRVGNMAVLYSSTEWVEELDEDEETGERSVTRRYKRPKLDVVAGPFWPMLCFVTYPLIFGVSGWAFFAGILPGGKSPAVVFGWCALTSSLIISLACTAFRDPGILYRHEQPPPHGENTWRWSDRALTYRPRNAQYDPDTAVVVEEFDHTCPWTGTAIGKRNMFPFQLFVCLVFVCMIMDIFVITGAI